MFGSQSECATEEESLLSSPSPGRPEQLELVKTWSRSIYSIESIFNEIVTIFKAEQATAGTVKLENTFNQDEGHILFKASNIAGFGRSHVSLFGCLFVLSCLLIITICLTAATTKK